MGVNLGGASNSFQPASHFVTSAKNKGSLIGKGALLCHRGVCSHLENVIGVKAPYFGVEGSDADMQEGEESSWHYLVLCL